MPRTAIALTLVWLGMLMSELRLPAEDWPQWRHDSYRSADTPEELPASLQLEWTRVGPPRVQVWDDPLNHDLMPYDRIFEPVVLGDRMFIGFNDRDKVVALDTRTGEELWTFFTDGPVRLPATAWESHVYFASDDGHLYCVAAATGAVVWKFQGAPSNRKALGNGRVISAWPARGGPVIRDGVIYFAASIWPFMGTFIYALDARDGHVIWVNDSTGAQYIKQPHGAPAFGGVAPQGALTATREFLLVPGGRSVPAAFERKTGQFLHFSLDEGGKGNGGSFVAANDSEMFVHTRLRGTRNHELKSGKKGSFTLNEPVLATNFFYTAAAASSRQTAVLDAEQSLASARQTVLETKSEMARAHDDGDSAAYKKATNSLVSAEKKVLGAEKSLATARSVLGTNWSGAVVQAIGKDKKVAWELPADGTGDLIKAGRRLYAAGSNVLLTIDLPRAAKDLPRIAASHRVQGSIQRLLAANQRLFAVTLDGRIMAFGSGGKPPLARTEPRAAKAATEDLAVSAKDGYALWFGLDDGRLLEANLRRSAFHVVAVDPDPAKVEQWRRRFDAAGLYGRRVTVHVGDPLSFKAPPYIANLVHVGESLAGRLAERSVLQAVYESVRPYGGFLRIAAGRAGAAGMERILRQAALANGTIEVGRVEIRVVREGALPGSADWTHQYGDMANTVKSDERLVRLPMGLLWFGGNSNMDVLPRHGHGPSPQVVGGRLFIEGMRSLSARDVYTGRVLWKNEYPDLDSSGVYFDGSYTNTPLSTAYNQKHIPGANGRGVNYVATAEAVYLVTGNACRVLDSHDGHPVQTLRLPRHPEDPEPRQWGFIGVHENVLLAGDGFAHYTRRLGLTTPTRSQDIVDFSASRGLVAFDRPTGKILWRIEAKHSFLHNGIVAGPGLVFCLDKMPKSLEDRLKRRGRNVPADHRLAAFDLKSGRLVWETKTNVFGTWLAYSKAHDILLQAGASASDRLKDEVDRGMITYRGTDGSVLWRNLNLRYTGPCILHNETILTTPGSFKTNAGAFSLLDGSTRTIVNPLTGQTEPLRIYRTYGCGYPVACENLITFRSGAAGYYDLESHSGTGNFGGYKSGCSPNLIAANGVLNSPDYTRTCSCAYQNQTSLALVHMPDLEIWTHNQFGTDSPPGQRIKRIGVNLGAPGDRLSELGTFWLEHPMVGGSSPHFSVVVKGSQTNYFRRHASQLRGAGPNWVMASGVRDLESIRISPETSKAPPPYAPRRSEDDDEPGATSGKESSTSSTTTNSAPAAVASTNALIVARLSTNQIESVKLAKLTPAPYTVRLYFAEPESLSAGERVFQVDLQGRPVLRDFDIAREASGNHRGIVKEFRGIVVGESLDISFKRVSRNYGPVLNGVEMILEDGSPSEPMPLSE